MPQQRLAVHCASTEEVIGRIPAGDERDADAAVAAAKAAFASRSETSPAERATFLQNGAFDSVLVNEIYWHIFDRSTSQTPVSAMYNTGHIKSYDLLPFPNIMNHSVDDIWEYLGKAYSTSDFLLVFRFLRRIKKGTHRG